jgi:Osteopetrosis-associated transmembrane protein 1 precursor
MSKYYDTIRLAKDNQICYDITDTVNKTRKGWSLDFKCCNDKSTDLTAFFSMAGVVGAMPLVFYLVMFLYTRRTERNTEILLSDQAEPDGPSTSSGVRPLTTREANESGLKKRHSGSSASSLEPEGQAVPALPPLIAL